MVKDYIAKKRAEKGLPAEKLEVDDLPADEDNAADDEEVRQKIQKMIETEAPNLLPIEGRGIFLFYDKHCCRLKLVGN